MNNSAKPRVIVVDDDKDITSLLKYNLEMEGISVKQITEPNKVLEEAIAFKPDLFILDIMMPHINGIDLCRQIRSLEMFKDTYIFFLTASNEKYYESAAFSVGGNDYIEKLHGLRSLVSKVSSVLKDKLIIDKQVRRLKRGNVMIDRENRYVIIGNRKVGLSEKEFELLFFFAQNPRKNISEVKIMKNIWGSEAYLKTGNVAFIVNSICNKIGKKLIEHVEGNSYRFNSNLS